MTATPTPNAFIRTLNGEKLAIPPIWFMRQAGRHLPEYRALRQDTGSFLDLCYNAEKAAEATLQPIRRYDLDAAILFADILLIPHAMGQNLTFEAGEGPKLDPVITPENIDQFRKQKDLSALSSIYETVTRVRGALAPEKALIGFAGAPWTVATYMLAGGPMKDPATLRQWYYQDRDFLRSLIDLLTDHTIDYLLAQIDAGADAVQVFDTWAGGLPWPVLDAVSIRPLLKIAEAVRAARPETPVILFPKGVGEKAADYVVSPACRGIGIDFSMDPSWARAHLADFAVVQGGLDPFAVIAGGDVMKRAADTYLKLFHDARYVFNLGHGVLPETPPDHVAALVRHVREGAWRA